MRRSTGRTFLTLLISISLPATVPGAAAETTQGTGTPPAEPINVVRGLVVDHEGKPVSDAQVALACAERGYIFYHGADQPVQTHGSDKRVLLFFKARNGKASDVVKTDESGRFESKSLMDGAYNVLACHPERGVVTMLRATSPADAEELRINLPPPAFVSGSIKGISQRAQGKGTGLLSSVPTEFTYIEPVKQTPGISMWLHLLDGSLDSFKLGPIPADGSEWKLQVMRFDSTLPFNAPLYQAILKPKAGETLRLNVDLTKGESLSGEVKGPDGKSLANVSVTVRSDQEPGVLYGALTDASGKYTINGLSQHAYKLEAKRWAKRTAPG